MSLIGILVLVVLVLALATSGAPHLALVGLFIGIAFVGFWVMMLRLLIGFGRWLMKMPPDRPRRVFEAGGSAGRRVVGTVLSCPDPRCGRANLTEAKYCAQCGRPLGRAA